MDHPLGSIIGNATYSNGVFIQQGVTIGANKGVVRPTFSGYVMLFTHAVVVGDCKIGKNVIISAKTYIKETDIPNNCIVFGQSPNLIIKPKSEEYMRNFFSQFFCE
jgi:serine O-acetyltransferase